MTEMTKDDVTEACKLIARYKKAKKLALALVQHGADGESAVKLGETLVGRSLAAKAVGGHVPSDVTWALVVEMVKEINP